MNVGGTGSEIGGAFSKIIWIFVALFVGYNLIFDPDALKRIPKDIASYLNSFTQSSSHTPKHK